MIEKIIGAWFCVWVAFAPFGGFWRFAKVVRHKWRTYENPASTDRPTGEVEDRP